MSGRAADNRRLTYDTLESKRRREYTRLTDPDPKVTEAARQPAMKWCIITDGPCNIAIEGNTSVTSGLLCSLLHSRGVWRWVTAL